jgi:hypothetical protein
MEQKNLRTTPSRQCELAAAGALHEDAAGGSLSDPYALETLRRLISTLGAHHGELPCDVQRSLRGPGGMRRLATAMTGLLTDYGGTSPAETCNAIAEVAPDLYSAFGQERVVALCEEIQYAEVAEQSARFQKMFETFNKQYFAGRLPNYRIRAVFDVWYWETKRCGYPPCYPPAFGAAGFIDFKGRQIFIRFPPHEAGFTMTEILLHEMAHTAAGGEHGEQWKREMARLKLLGAPVDEVDLQDDSDEPKSDVMISSRLTDPDWLGWSPFSR